MTLDMGIAFLVLNFCHGFAVMGSSNLLLCSEFITEAFVFLMQQLDLMWKQFSTTISNFKYGILVSLLISLDL